jgi:hypothetical protein
MYGMGSVLGHSSEQVLAIFLQLSLPIHGLTLAHISIVIFLEIVIVRDLTTLVAASSDL